MRYAYDNLIGPDGQPRFGIFDAPVRNINAADYDYLTAMDEPANRFQKHFGFNQFQFIGVAGPDFIFGCALVDIKYVGNCFIYLYDRINRRLYEHSFLLPLAIATRLSTQPDGGESSFNRGDVKVTLTAHDHPRHRILDVRIGRDFQAELNISEQTGFQPLAICTKTGFNGWTYTQKAAGLSVEGFIKTPHQRFAVGKHHRASYDWTAGYMRRETSWNWGCMLGQTTSGDTVGINFSNGVNETSFTENVFWINGAMNKVNLVRFQYPRRQRRSEWRMTSDDGKVNLRFEPDGERKERINAFVLASNFTQLFGRYYGTLTDSEGTVHTLDGVPGFAEDHYAKW